MSKQRRPPAARSPEAHAEPAGLRPADAPRGPHLRQHASPADLLALQRTLGNRAVGRLLSGGAAPAPLQRALEPDDSWGWQPWPFNPNAQLWNDVNAQFDRIPALRLQLQQLQDPIFDGTPSLNLFRGILGHLYNRYNGAGLTLSRPRAEVLVPLVRGYNNQADNLIAGVPAQRQQQLQQEQNTLTQLRQRLGGLLQEFTVDDLGVRDTDSERTDFMQQLQQQVQANQLLGQAAVAGLTRKTERLERNYQASAAAVRNIRRQRAQLASVDASLLIVKTLKDLIALLKPTDYQITDRSDNLEVPAAPLRQLRRRIEQEPLDDAALQQALQAPNDAIAPIRDQVQLDVRASLSESVTNLRQNLAGLNERQLSRAENQVRVDRAAALAQVAQVAQGFTLADHARVPAIVEALNQGEAFYLQAVARLAELRNVAVQPAVQDQIAGINAGDMLEGLHTPAAIRRVTAYVQTYQNQVAGLLAVYKPELIRKLAADNVTEDKWFDILPTLRQEDWGGAPNVTVDLAGAVGQVPVTVDWNHILQVHVNRYATPAHIEAHSYNQRTSFWRDSNATAAQIGAAIKACIEDAALQATVRGAVVANAKRRLAAVVVNDYKIGVSIEEGPARGTVVVSQFYDDSIPAGSTFSQEESVQLSQYMALKR